MRDTRASTLNLGRPGFAGLFAPWLVGTKATTLGSLPKSYPISYPLPRVKEIGLVPRPRQGSRREAWPV